MDKLIPIISDLQVPHLSLRKSSANLKSAAILTCLCWLSLAPNLQVHHCLVRKKLTAGGHHREGIFTKRKRCGHSETHRNTTQPNRARQIICRICWEERITLLKHGIIQKSNRTWNWESLRCQQRYQPYPHQNQILLTKSFEFTPSRSARNCEGNCIFRQNPTGDQPKDI